MSKNKDLENPFEAFDILKGNFIQPSAEEDEIITGDENVIDDEPVKSELNEEADKALNKVIEQQIKATSKKTEEVVEDVEDEDISKEDSDKLTNSNGFIDAIKELREKAILDIDTDDIEDSEEGFDKAIQETVNNRIKKHIANLGDEAVDFLAFIEQGGNPRDFIKTYYSENSWETFDLESENSQKAAIRESLKLAGETPEDIEDLISEFEDNGTLEKRAKSALTKLQKFEKEQKTQLIEIQKQKAEEQKQANIKYWNEFKSDLDKREDIKGFKVTSKVKDNLWKFMTTVDKTSGKTEYQKAVENNQDASLLFAYLAMNNFDISKLEKQVESKAASKVASLLKNYQPTSKEKISGGRTKVDAEGEDPFALFSKMK